LLITDLLPDSEGPERRGMLMAAVELWTGPGFSGSSGLGSVGVLRVNMKRPPSLLAPMWERPDRTTASWWNYVWLPGALPRQPPIEPAPLPGFLAQV
jgi:hypothetical protein